MFECPFYKENNACNIHPYCVFKKAGGCAIELAAIFSEENKQEIKEIKANINNLIYKIDNIEFDLRQLTNNRR